MATLKGQVVEFSEERLYSGDVVKTVEITTDSGEKTVFLDTELQKQFDELYVRVGDRIIIEDVPGYGQVVSEED